MKTRLERWESKTEWPLTVIAIVFLVVYTWEVIGHQSGDSRRIAEWILNAMWFLFGVDYVVRLTLAPEKGPWFVRHIPDLLAVALPMFRPLRLLRLLPLLGVLQRSAGTALRGRITMYTAGSVVLLCFIASLAVLDAERRYGGSGITDFGEAVWWSIVTITTVGYGDIAPVSPVGRAIAALLMIGGIALIGVVMATLASWIVSRVEEDSDEARTATSAEIARLESQIAALSAQIDRLGGETGSGR